MSKKFLSLVLAFAMLLGLFQSVSAFNIAEDVKGTDLETTAAVLGSLNIMTGDADTGNFRPNDSIKRSEVARVAISAKEYPVAFDKNGTVLEERGFTSIT